ncbi:MAG: ribosome maturation factor RimP [Bacilli bacterium]|jgi:ribosome maturation factor RimP
MEIENKIKGLIKTPLLSIDINIDSVSYIKEDNTNYLRIVIDKDNYINIDDCVEVTKIINKILDKEDLINESYILDVCSKEKGGHKNGY